MKPDLITKNSQKLMKLKYLLQNCKLRDTPVLPDDNKKTTNSIFYLSLVEKPINLMFSRDQFLFEFSKKTYQQKKAGEFFQQLKERKKLSLFYGGLSRKYLVNLFTKAKTIKGSLSKNVLCLLERRLDVMLYRSGLTKTIAEARQLILHKKILINHKPVNLPASLVEPGDLIEITPKTMKSFNLPGVQGLKTKSRNNYPQIFGDFYSKLKKSLSKPLLKKKIATSGKPEVKSLWIDQKKKLSRETFKSRQLCRLFIDLLCTQMKAKSYLNLKENVVLPNQKKPVFILYKNSKKLSRTFFEKETRDRKLFLDNDKFLKTPQGKSAWHFSKTKGATHFSKTKGNGINEFFQKKPLFWSRKLTSSKFEKKQKATQQYQKSHRLWKQKNGKNKFLLGNYRYCFLHFIKSLDNYRKFSGLVDLNLKKSISKKYLYRRKSAVLNRMTFRVSKPIHLEVSYKLLNVIYLYAPQRLNYPFLIDFDIINRSLS